MNRPLFRPTEPGDLEALTGLWQSAFHDPAALVRRLLTEGGLLRCGMTAELEGRLASVMFAFPGLELGGRSAAYLYALCTHPEFRGRGLGSGVLDALAAHCFDNGSELVFLSPAGDGLAHWYQERLGMTRLGGVSDVPQPLCTGAAGRCIPIGVEAYLSGRSGRAVTAALLRAQAVLLDDGGGGLFRLSLSAGEALACALPTRRGLLVLELLCSPGVQSEALGTLAAHFSTKTLLLRCPGMELPLLCRSRDGGGCGYLPELCFPFIME